MINTARKAFKSSAALQSIKGIGQSSFGSEEFIHLLGPVALANQHRCQSTYMQMFQKLRLAQGPDPVESPRLTPQMVNSILRMNETSYNAESRGIVKTVHVNQLQSNKPIEDRHAEATLFGGTNKYLFGMFDGHAGCACAQALKDRLFHYVAVALADPKILNTMSQGGQEAVHDMVQCLPTSPHDLVNADLAELHWQSLYNFINDSLDVYSFDNSVEEGLSSAFLRLDQDISTEATFHPGDSGLSSDLINIALSGSVGCMAYINGLDLYLANVGDTQAVIGSYSSDTETWQATNLCQHHNADNLTEVKRLFHRHPNESNNILKGGRLFGELIPLRAFGDVRYKWEKRDLIQLQELCSSGTGPFLQSYKNINIPNNYRTPPYLDAEPEIVHYRLSPKDKFLILATDGLWDSEGMTVDKVVSLVGHHTEGQQVLTRFRPPEVHSLGSINSTLKKRRQDLAKRAVDENVTTHLIRHALGMEHGHVSAQLTLPQGVVRYYRDDITITVVNFDTDYIMDFSRKH